MQMSIQALREQRAAKAKALNELANKAEWNADVDSPIYDAAVSEIGAIDAQIERINKANELAADQALTNHVADAAARAGRDQGSDGARLYAKWLRGGDSALSAAEWASIRNTMSVGGTPSEGGYTVATDVATSVLDALKAFGGMRAVAEVIRTAGGNPMSFPTSNGTAEVGEIVPENTAATDADVSFGTLGLPVYKYSSKVVTVPFELLQDSSVDIEAFVRNRLATRLARITNTHFTTGTGTAQPNGIVTASTLGVTAASATAIAYDDLVELVHSVDPAYRDGAKFLLNDSSVKALKKLKDSQGRPLWVPGVDVREPDTFLGYGYEINQDIASIATGNKTILFGQLNAYVIRDVMSVEMFRFTDSAYAKKGQVGFLAWMRSGGNLIDVGGAVKHLKQA
jgi:HK97 family phage major capsid protein